MVNGATKVSESRTLRPCWLLAAYGNGADAQKDLRSKMSAGHFIGFILRYFVFKRWASNSSQPAPQKQKQGQESAVKAGEGMLQLREINKADALRVKLDIGADTDSQQQCIYQQDYNAAADELLHKGLPLAAAQKEAEKKTGQKQYRSQREEGG